jgi:hypothetical protein
MVSIILSIIIVLVIYFIIPFIAYGLASVITGLKPPENVSPSRFLFSVLITKFGTSIAFVLLYYISRESLSGQWHMYAIVWWLMFVIGEIGQAIGPNYTKKEAILGIISETIYIPLSAFIINQLIG